MNLWKRKLAAYLHDPPSKCADLANHDERSESALRAAGFTQDECRAFAKQADLTASSADRFPFPGSRSSGLTCGFDGVRAGFHHPLGSGRSGEPCVLGFAQGQEITGFEAVEGQLEQREQTVQPILTADSLAALGEEDMHWRARFFAHWRLWPQFAADRDSHFSFLPADTRLPDHTIWTHNSIVAALASCAELGDIAAVASPEEWVKRLRSAPLRPAFLKFHMGPVQEFIAQARSTRDLWSGSYLLSWLMAAGMKALSVEVGPDAVIFPNLRGQPLFDLHWRDELWRKVRIGDRSVWDTLRESATAQCAGNAYGNDETDLLTPNLPNVFLAVVPAGRAGELGRLVSNAIRKEWEVIRDSVWQKVQEAGFLELCPPELREHEYAHERFVAHTDRFLSIAWHALPWPRTLREAHILATSLPANMPRTGERSLLQRFDAVVDAATKAMPKDHRDPRYYSSGESGPKDALNNIGLGWALLTALNGWGLDAVRQTRDFRAWGAGGWQHNGVAQSKDALTGREEMIFGGAQFADRLKELPNLRDAGEWAKLFKHDDEVGAITLVKRVWHWSYLADVWKLRARRGQFCMPNTHSIADHRPSEDDAEENLQQESDEPNGGKYFAVLALDGDEIGKWVSGDKCPPYRSQLADYWDSPRIQRQGALEYFMRESDPDGQGRLKDRFANLLQTRRLVSPSYHLQFSEALSNFALRCARPIIEAFDGRLVYAGGDDVLAMLPADTALKCAAVLRSAFQGREVVDPRGRRGVLFHSHAPGFLSSEHRKDDHGRGRPIPFLVPGPAADCSVGIAIAHFKSPLQDVVRAAQDAEKRAKKQLGRSAVAVTLMKRSGEIIEWGAKWDKGLELYGALADALEKEEISAKFPHRWTELLEAYTTNTTPLVRECKTVETVEQFPVDEIIRREFDHTLRRQCGAKFPKEPPAVRELTGNLQTALVDYLQSLDAAEKTKPEERLQALIGLCQTVAFIDRNRDKSAESPSVAYPSSVVSKPQAERQPA